MLKGRYVGLRAIEASDLPLLQEWRNRPEYRRYFREYRELNSDMQRQWYEKDVLSNDRVCMFAMVDLAKDCRLLGVCGLCYINWVDSNADFSIYIGSDKLYIDDRFAVDGGKILLRYGFEELGLHRMWAEIYDFDEPKKQLFDTLGFKRDGRHRETHWSEGRWHDSLFYSLLFQEFKPPSLQKN